MQSSVFEGLGLRFIHSPKFSLAEPGPMVRATPVVTVNDSLNNLQSHLTQRCEGWWLSLKNRWAIRILENIEALWVE